MPQEASVVTIIIMVIIFFVISIPLTLFIFVVTFPYKIYRILTRKSAEKSKIKVKITAPSEGTTPLDDLLFIHGWPDCGDLWDDQVKVLSKEYRCIVVTMPNYDGNENHETSWGYDFDELTEMLADVVRNHSKK